MDIFESHSFSLKMLIVLMLEVLLHFLFVCWFLFLLLALFTVSLSIFSALSIVFCAVSSAAFFFCYGFICLLHFFLELYLLMFHFILFFAVSCYFILSPLSISVSTFNSCFMEVFALFKGGSSFWGFIFNGWLLGGC